MRSLRVIAILAFITMAVMASAQFFQPWTPPAKSFTSRVQSCANALYSPAAAYDDFVSANTLTLHVLAWWGNVSTPTQLTRPYYVAIYNTIPGACLPDIASGPIYHACVIPVLTSLAGTDCTGHNVYVFVSHLPSGGFPAVAGVKYWLQISENDNLSVNPGVDDFRWSGHFGPVMCPALQITSFGTINQPLQGCGALNDLAFGIF